MSIQHSVAAIFNSHNFNVEITVDQDISLHYFTDRCIVYSVASQVKGT